MKIQRALIALTVVNLGLLMFLLAQMRPVEHLRSRGVDELQHVLAVEGKERRVHDLEDAPDLLRLLTQ